MDNFSLKKFGPGEIFSSDSDSEMKKVIIEVMGQLKPSYQEILVMHYYEEMTYKQISDEIGINPFSARVRLFRATMALTKKFNEYMKKKQK